jgi:hypothetical protein
MFVSIDMEGLRVLHAHTDQDAVWGLVYIECANLDHIRVDSTERPHFLSNLTHLELKLLYQNITGVALPWTDELALREAIGAACECLTPRQIRMSEIDAQIEFVCPHVETGRKTFKYVYGSNRAQEVREFFPLKGSPLSAERLALAQQPPQRYLPPSAPAPAAAPVSRPQGPRFAPPAKAGTVRPKIWAVADRMWEEAGKPTDKNIVLNLRKQMMTQLEEEGIKKTSSSNELGNWMKDRIP